MSTVHGRADHRGAEGARGRAGAADLTRRHGVSEATLYNWKAKYGGMDVSEAKRLKQLEDENAKLKKLLAEQMLDGTALRELLSNYPDVKIFSTEEGKWSNDGGRGVMQGFLQRFTHGQMDFDLHLFGRCRSRRDAGDQGPRVGVNRSTVA